MIHADWVEVKLDEEKVLWPIFTSVGDGEKAISISMGACSVLGNVTSKPMKTDYRTMRERYKAQK